MSWRRAVQRGLRCSPLLEWRAASSLSGAERHQHLVESAAQAPSRGAARWPLAGAAAVLGLAGSAATALTEADTHEPPQAQKAWGVISLEQRRRHFFTYEKRVREMSSAEKSFEYFASLGDMHKGFTMTAGDVMRSVVPVFPPQGSDIVRAGRLPGEPSAHIQQEDSALFNLFDMDGSGGITYDEWLLFKSLLSVPVDDAEVAFMLVDTDSNGFIDKEEFSVMLQALERRVRRRSATLRRSVGAGLQASSGGLMAEFFGAHGKGKLSLARFEKFLQALRDEMVRLEFLYYDYQRKGTISGHDFAHSVVGCARLKHLDHYLARVDALPSSLASASISFADFCTFRAMWRQLRRLASALEFWRSSSGGITKGDFQRVARHVLGGGISPVVVDILFHLFEEEGGGLNVHFMVMVMDRGLETGRSIHQESQSGEGPSLLECMAKCTQKR